MNLTYLRRSWKNLLRSIRGPGRSTSNLYSRACRYGSVYYDGYGYSGHGPRRAFYSRKTSLYSTRNGLATGGKNHGGSPLRGGVRDIYNAPYRRNDLSYTKKMTYIRVRRA